MIRKDYSENKTDNMVTNFFLGFSTERFSSTSSKDQGFVTYRGWLCHNSVFYQFNINNLYAIFGQEPMLNKFAGVYNWS